MKTNESRNDGFVRPTGRLILVLLALFLILGCATTFAPEPQTEADTLVVAAYRFEQSDVLREALGSSLRLRNVRLQARLIDQEPESSGLVSLRSRSGNILALAGARVGTYQLLNLDVDVYFESERVGGGQLDFEEEFFFEVREGTVSNVGRFVVNFADEENITYRFAGDFDSVLDEFEERYETSSWLHFEWVDQAVSR